MKTNNIIILLLGVLISFVSCNDDFLERTPQSQITPENYLWDAVQLEAYSIYQYGLLTSHTTSGTSWGTFGIDTHTDNMAEPNYAGKFAPGEWKVPQSGGNWTFSYIYGCNYFLNTVIPRWKDGGITGSSDLIQHYIGEMYFLRAYEYFKKVQAFGDFPIIKHTLSDDSKVLTEASRRLPHSEVVRFIIADLDSAIMLMSANAPDGARNRLSKPCALLFKSRVALYEATWLKYFKGTPFVPNGPNWPGAEKEHNRNYQFQAGSIDEEINWLLAEAMSSSQQVADNFPLTTNTGNLQQDVTEAPNPFYDMYASVDLSGYDEVLMWRRYDRGLGVVNNIPRWSASGNGAYGTTKGMVECFLMNNGLPIYASESGYHGDDYIADVRKDRDNRLWLFLKESGQKNLLINLTSGSHSTPVEPVPNITMSAPNQKYCTGYTIRKGCIFDGLHYDEGQGFVGSIIFRAGEAYLNYMEACYEKNNSLDDKAKKYWIDIRNRAKVDTNFEKTIAETDMNIEAKGDWGAYSAGNLINPTLYNIRRERRCELMAEGFRKMDLYRWRAMDQLIATPYHIEGFKLWGPMQEWYKNSNGDSQLIYGSTSANVSSPEVSRYLRPYQITGKELVYNGYKWVSAHYLDPIPIQEFLLTSIENDLTTSTIHQNPGWPITAGMSPVE
jgi:hypothetical protein